MLAGKPRFKSRKLSRPRSLLRRVVQSALEIIAHTPVVYLIKQIISSSDVKFLTASLFNIRVSRCVWLPLPVRWLLLVTVILYILGEATVLCSELFFPGQESTSLSTSSSDEGKDSDDDSTADNEEADKDERSEADDPAKPLSVSRQRTKSPSRFRV